MKTFIQYGPEGNISATVWGVTAPEHPSQLVLDGFVDTYKKKVDLATMTLIDLPAIEPEA